MTYITARFGVPVAKPRQPKVVMTRMTEEEYGQRMRDMCRREGHHQGIPHKHVHGNPAPRLNYDIVMADVLALLADGPLPSPAIETRLKRGHETIRTATRRLAARNAISYDQKRRRWSLAAS